MSITLRTFQKTVWDYYGAHGRALPWRIPEKDGNFDPYKIMVSEIMLQQTQVNRVVSKYHEFLTRFPDMEELSRAPLAEVIRSWSGLGYNRRAKFLQDAAKAILKDGDLFPQTLNALTNLPGIGPNTAAAILVYAYNQPLIFIETNIRTVVIHHFFADQTEVSDSQLRPIIEAALDQTKPREWYWALMDYGTHLKAVSGNANRNSRHYKKQSAFHGSLRQLRGAILRELALQPQANRAILHAFSDSRTPQALEGLLRDGLIQFTDGSYRLAD